MHTINSATVSRSVCLYDNEGHITGHFGIQRDITERKQLEIRLRQVIERLQLTLDHLTIVAYEIDLNGIFLLSRGKGLEKLNLQPDEVFGQSIFDVYSDFPTLIQAVHKALAGEPQQIEVEITNVIWQANFVPVVNDSGVVERVFGTVFDITTQHQAEASARGSEAHFRALIEHSHDVIALIDATGIIHYKSPAVNDPPLEAVALNFAPKRYAPLHLLNQIVSFGIVRVAFLFVLAI